MIIHFLSIVVSIIFLSFSPRDAEATELTFKNPKHAINYWATHCQDPDIDIRTVRQGFDPFIFDYQDLLEKGFDSLSITDYRGQVFSNINVTLSDQDGDIMEKLCAVLIHPHSWITKLTIDEENHWGNDRSKYWKLQEDWKNFPSALNQNVSLSELNLGKLTIPSKILWDGILTALVGKQRLKTINISDHSYHPIIAQIITKNNLEEIVLDRVDIAEDEMLTLINALKKSSVKKLSLQENRISLTVGHALVSILDEGKKFDKLDLTNCKWAGNSYQRCLMVKNIGMAARGKVNTLGLEPYVGQNDYKEDHYSFDYGSYNPKAAFLRDYKYSLMATMANLLLILGFEQSSLVTMGMIGVLFIKDSFHI